jgi:hypothetical protein
VFNGVVDKALVKTGRVGLTEKTLRNAAEDAMVHHAAFINKFIIQKSVDPFKIISWYGFFLSKNADDPTKSILLLAIAHLNDLLSKEHLKLKLSAAHVQHLYNMAKLDGSDDEFGIGKNGIYSVFSSCIDLVSDYKPGSKIIHAI